MGRIITALTALVAITSTASGQEASYDYLYRVQGKVSYALPYRTQPPDFRFARGYAVGAEVAVRLKPTWGIGISAALISRDTLTSSIFGAALNIHTAPAVSLKVGVAGIRVPYHIYPQPDTVGEIRSVTMPALQLGGEFMRAPFERNTGFVFTVAIDNYVMFYNNRKLPPPPRPFEKHKVESGLVMVPVISAGFGILVGGAQSQ